MAFTLCGNGPKLHQLDERGLALSGGVLVRYNNEKDTAGLSQGEHSQAAFWLGMRKERRRKAWARHHKIIIIRSLSMF